MDCGMRETREFLKTRVARKDKEVKEIAYVTIARASNSIKSVVNQRKL